MKKLLIFILSVLTLTICLSGCYLNKKMYHQEDAGKVTAKGTEMMQVWLDENMPDATLEECTAFIAWTNYDGNKYLTDYAFGQISQNGKKKTFTINTVTGAVYFEMDADTRQKLTKIVESYFDEAIESIGIVQESVDEGYEFQCYVMAPAKDGESKAEVPWVYSFDFGLPAGVEDLNAFVRNPQSRLPIYVNKPNFTVSDTKDLSAYDLVAMETLEEEYGFHIGSMSINNVDQHFQKNDYQGKTCTELWEYGCWYKADGFELFGMVYEHSEERTIKTNELTVSDIKFNPETDLLFEQMSYGYRWSVLNEDWPSDYSFVLRAYKGAEILNSDFYYLDTKENPSAKSLETIWLERDGYYVLASAANQTPLKLYDDKKLVRKNQTDRNGINDLISAS